MIATAPFVRTVTSRGRGGATLSLGRMGELSVHKAVVAHLAARARPGVIWWHTPNGGARTPAEAGIFRALGTRAGMPDLMLLDAGRLYALELKATGGRVSAAQTATLADLAAAGATVAVAEGLDVALATLADWGVFRPSRRV